MFQEPAGSSGRESLKPISALFSRGDGRGARASLTPGREHASRALLALPRFLDLSKSLAISHAEISALYFIVEDYFESAIENADREDPVDEARVLATAAARRHSTLESGQAHGNLRGSLRPSVGGVM